MVLPVDPVGDQHGRGHERLQQAAVGVFLGVIVVQKAASLQCSAQRPVPGRDDEGCVARQAPFRACLGAIVGAPAQLLQQIVVRHPWVDVQVRRPFSADLATGMVQHRLQAVPPLASGWGQQVQVKALDLIGCGVVQGRHEGCGLRNGDALFRQARAHGRFVQQLRQAAGADFAGLAAACAAVQRCRMGVVGRLAAMPYQQYQGRQISVQPHGAQHPRCQRHLGADVQPRELGAAQGAIARRQAFQCIVGPGLPGGPQPLAQLARIAHARRLNERERRTRPAAGGQPLVGQRKAPGACVGRCFL